MKPEEIIEGNRIIAEFMQYNYKENCITELPSGLGERVYDRPMTEEDLQYHKSWAWLMPVVENIEALHSFRVGSYISVEIMQGYVKVHGTTESIFRNTSVEGSKIKAVWLAVIEFIKWYNTNIKYASTPSGGKTKQ